MADIVASDAWRVGHAEMNWPNSFVRTGSGVLESFISMVG